MSLLHYHQRPWEIFDPTNKRHREWFVEFQNIGSWKSCPVRFIVPDYPATDVATAIQKKLIEYYIKKEFKETPDHHNNASERNQLFKFQ